MTTLPSCSRCGWSSLPPFQVGGICLRCAGLHALEGDWDAPLLDEPEALGDVPERIGPYDLIEELGRGGMGRVFAARQRALGRIVALKVIASESGRASDLHARFFREAHTIARLRHPHIVSIHDLGRANGLDYFSMDYVEGGDLARRLRERPFTPREAAELVAKVADALAYSHAHGVLHRDIKPSNILLDGDEPRLADFGLAADLEPGGDLTEATMVLGTPHYLAPEAIRGGSAALSERSDVYALGVVLFQLLTGRTPFAGATAAELPALLDGSDPPAPRLLAPAVPRDLETVCLACLEREPARRYAAATALADDLRHFLAGEPIMARRPGRLHTFLKFARRHRTWFIAGSVLAAVLVAATIVSAALAVRARRAEQRAATAAKSSAALSDFLRTDLLGQADPRTQPDRDLKLRTVLDTASGRLDGRFPGEPLIEADLRVTLGETYAQLGVFDAAAAHLRRAAELRTRELGPDDPKTLQARSDYANTLNSQGRFAEAEPIALDVLARVRRSQGADSPEVIHAMNLLTNTYHDSGRLPQAQKMAEDALQRARSALPTDHEFTRQALNNLSSVYWAEDRLADAERLNLEAAEADARTVGPEHIETLLALANLASVYYSENKIAQADATGRKVLAAQVKLLGPLHPETLRTEHNLATTLHEEARYAEAATLERHVFEARQAALGPDHLDTLSSMSALAFDLSNEGKHAEAISMAQTAAERTRRVAGPTHFRTEGADGVLATVLRRAGRHADADEIYVRLAAARRQQSGPDSAAVVSIEGTLGMNYLEWSHFAQAETLLRHAYTLRAKHKPNDWATFLTESELGGALAGEKRLAEAEPLELEGYRRLAAAEKQLPGVDLYLLRDAGLRLVSLYRAQGRTADADALAAKLGPQGGR